jgi:hypothetical protein
LVKPLSDRRSLRIVRSGAENHDYPSVLTSFPPTGVAPRLGGVAKTVVCATHPKRRKSGPFWLQNGVAQFCAFATRLRNQCEPQSPCFKALRSLSASALAASAYHPATQRYTTIPNHPGDMPEGTLRAILKQAGIEPEVFLKK